MSCPIPSTAIVIQIENRPPIRYIKDLSNPKQHFYTLAGAKSLLQKRKAKYFTNEFKIGDKDYVKESQFKN